MLSPEIAGVLAKYSLPPNLKIEPHPSGSGFSGARLWKCSAGERAWCLRCYGAEHPTAERLAAIHGAVLAAAAVGIDFLAPPFTDRGGETIVRANGRLWDLSSWMPGQAVANPTEAQAVNAMTGLARLHHVWRDLPWDNLGVDVEGPTVIGPPPGLAARLRFLTSLTQGGFNRIKLALPSFWAAEWYPTAQRILERFVRDMSAVSPGLQIARHALVPRQVCLRDARAEHFLFVGDRLSGIIDYDAVRVDSPMADVARLLGDWGSQAMVDGFGSYLALRPMSSAENHVLCVFMSSARLLTGMQWLQWLVVERREFDDEAAIARRLRGMLPA